MTRRREGAVPPSPRSINVLTAHHARVRAIEVLSSAVICAGTSNYAIAADSLAEVAASALFVQGGTGSGTHEVTVGLAWDWSRHWSVGPGVMSGYWDVSVSRWSYRAPASRRTVWLAQLGVKPVLRWRPDDGRSPWFFEIGVGATLTTNLYETDTKRFSTSFNFGDHLAVGRSFGDGQRHELALRAEHFSNAGIKHPNPGENFVQLRYQWRF